jgi:hypothetical protein
MKLLFLLPLLCWGKICLYAPPSDWQPSKPKDLRASEIGFVQKGSGSFNASLNLAEEKVTCSLEEYVKAVQKIHLAVPHTQWTDLGKISMKAGQGRLIEIRRESPFGKIVLFQGIFLQNGTAHVLTAACAKEDLPKFQKEILSSMRSLELVDDLMAEGVNIEQSNRGKYWQYLAIKERVHGE